MKGLLTNNQFVYYYNIKDDKQIISIIESEELAKGLYDMRPYIHVYRSQKPHIQKHFMNFFNKYLNMVDLPSIDRLEDLISTTHILCFVLAMQYYFL